MNLQPKMVDRLSPIALLLSESEGRPISFDRVAEAARLATGRPAFVVSRRGKILGRSERNPFDGPESFDDRTTRQLLEATRPSVLTLADDCGVAALEHGTTVTVVPVEGSGLRMGSVVLSGKEPLDEAGLALAELAASVVAMEILRVRASESEARARARTSARVAVESLSYSELEAARAIFDALGGDEGLLVASRIADREGITRSVIVNALRKLESADMIESRSLGMKGTHIRVRSSALLEELRKLLP